MRTAAPPGTDWLHSTVFIIALVLLTLGASTSVGLFAARSLPSGLADIQASHDASVALQGLCSTVDEMASDHDRFLASGQSRFLDRYRDAAQSVPDQIARLRSLSIASLGQQRALDGIAQQLAAAAGAVDAAAAQPQASLHRCCCRR